MGAYEDTPEVPNIVLLAERQRGLARSVGDLLKWRNGRDGMDAWRAVTDDRLEGLEGKIVALTRAVDALRRTILAFAFTIAGSCIVFALSVLIATGKI